MAIETINSSYFGQAYNKTSRYAGAALKHALLEGLEDADRRLSSLISGKNDKRVAAELYAASLPLLMLDDNKAIAHLGAGNWELFVRTKSSLDCLPKNTRAMSPEGIEQAADALALVRMLRQAVAQIVSSTSFHAL